jgi:hypothetical protein
VGLQEDACRLTPFALEAMSQCKTPDGGRDAKLIDRKWRRVRRRTKTDAKLIDR